MSRAGDAVFGIVAIGSLVSAYGILDAMFWVHKFSSRSVSMQIIDLPGLAWNTLLFGFGVLAFGLVLLTITDLGHEMVKEDSV